MRMACADNRSSFALSPSAKHAIPSTIVPCKAEMQMSSVLLLKESRALFSQRRPRSPRGMDANATWSEKLTASIPRAVRAEMNDAPRNQGRHCPDQVRRCLTCMVLSHECRRVEEDVLLVMYKVKIDLYQLSDELLIRSIVHGQRRARRSCVQT